MNGADSAQELPPLTLEELSQRPLTRVAQRFAVLATLLLPIAVIPYLVTRRQVSTLRTQVRESGLAAAQLQGRWRGALKEAAAVHDLHAQTQGLLDRTRQELRALQRETGELRDKFEAASVEGEARREENVQLRGLVEELCRGMNRLHDVGERHETVLQQLPQRCGSTLKSNLNGLWLVALTCMLTAGSNL
jgi:hypothetical protein